MTAHTHPPGWGPCSECAPDDIYGPVPDVVPAPRVDAELMRRAVSHHQFLTTHHQCVPECGTQLAYIYNVVLAK